MFPQKRKDRSAQQMKQRHVVIKYVPILHQPMSPSPHHVQMLRFVAVESKKENVPEFEQTSQNEKADSDPELSSAGEAEIILKPAGREAHTESANSRYQLTPAGVMH